MDDLLILFPDPSPQSFLVWDWDRYGFVVLIEL